MMGVCLFCSGSSGNHSREVRADSAAGQLSSQSAISHETDQLLAVAETGVEWSATH